MSDLCSQIERFGKGIGNTSRYRIFEALFKGPKTVNQLVAAVKQSQPAVSQHLKVLKECGIAMDKRCGQEVYYSLNSEHILELLKNLSKEVSNQKIKV